MELKLDLADIAAVVELANRAPKSQAEARFLALIAAALRDAQGSAAQPGPEAAPDATGK
jgi:hypothetical protein